MVATEGLLTDQVTEVVMLEVVALADPIWLAPSAVNCAVCPIAVSRTVPAGGLIEMDFSELQPASAKAIGNTSRADNTDAERRGIIEESPRLKLLSACHRAP